MNRRTFLATLGAAALSPAILRGADAMTPTPMIQTVTGPVAPGDLGFVLPHEHLFLDFRGADAINPAEWDEDHAFESILPHARRIREMGVDTLVECTPDTIGRNAGLLRRLSVASGLTILTNTGNYAAAGERFIPAWVRAATVDEIAARWIGETRDGIGDTGIRPGFIKIGVDGGTLTPLEEKIVRAAARAHRETGLTIAGHTGDDVAAFAQLDVLESEGVAPSAFIWVHAQLCTDSARHVEAGRRGAWVEFDHIMPGNYAPHADYTVAMDDAGLLDRVLLSHDAGWYDAGTPGGGNFRFFGDLVEVFIPMLRERGFSDAEIRQLTHANCHAAFTPRMG